MTQAIGVFDSGLGGLTVVRELRIHFPKEEIYYLGDTARVPYGTKSPQTVARYALTCQEFLLAKKVKLVLVACNTASAHALAILQERAPVPVVGAVEPGARAALEASQSGHIAVLGTLGTVHSGAYEAAIAKLETSATVVAQACPLFVPLAEEGWGHTNIAELCARRYLSELFQDDDEIDTLVLGCTHYPLLREVIEKVCKEVCKRPISIVDSAAAMVTQAADYILNQQEQDDSKQTSSEQNKAAEPGKLHCFVTDASRMQEVAPRFLGESLEQVDLVDLQPISK